MGMRREFRWVVLSIFVLAIIVVPLLQSQLANAAQITARTLTLQAGAGGDGGSKAGGSVNHSFSFTLPNTGSGNIGSIKFLYCTAAAGTCTTPTGLVTTSATMGSQSGATGFTLVNTTNGSPYITRTAASITAGTAVSYQLLAVTNPTTVNASFYVRISSYTSTDTTGSAIDTGTVAGSTAEQIVLTGIMPESLIFCTGATVNLNCSSTTAGTIDLGVFNPSAATTATSQMAASTNSQNGYSITVNGATLTSGSNTIPAMGTQAAPTVGTSQFGLNLRANTTAVSTPAVGAEISPSSNGGGLRGQAFTGYQTADQFKFTTGDVIANSASSGGALGTVGVTPGPTNSQVYTTSYLVNVSGIQPPGTYTTTLTYICTATF
ncbi:MAG: hypothetical protein WBB39_00250 [Candidatus Saccharimonadales bacterium]